MSILRHFALSFVSIFVALDIVGALPMFIGMTRALPRNKRNEALNTSMLVAFVVAIVFVFLGDAIFRYIGITAFDFKIAGGLVLLLVSLADLLGHAEAADRASGQTGVVPLAVPLITGPGVLTTLILQVNLSGLLITTAALLLNYLIAWGLLRNSDHVERVIGKDGTVVISKVAALLLAAIAVAMIRVGLFDAVRSFGMGHG